MLRVMLVNPPTLTNRDIKPVISNLFFNSPPLGLCFIAALLEREGIEVCLIDAPVEGLTHEDVVNRVRDFQPQLFGVSSTTVWFDAAVELARQVKELDDALPVAIGGAHVSSNTEETLGVPHFDFGVIGEGEFAALELARAIQKGNGFDAIKGLAYRENGEIRQTERRPYLRDLDVLPHPARQHVPIHKYRAQPNDEHRLPKTSMVTSRGCPYRCIFCDKSVFGPVYRYHSPDYIVEEMESLVEEYGIKDIAFIDSTFFPSKKRILPLLAKIREANLDMSWTCSARADVLTKDLMKEMKAAGCWRVRIGAESGNDEVLKFIGKGVTKENIRNAAVWANEVGLQPKGFFMVGHQVDTPETIEETIQFAKSLPFKDVTVQINTPLRAAKQYQERDKYGKFVTQEREALSFWEPSYIPDGLSREHLLAARNRFYRSFYCRPITVWRHLRAIRSFSQLGKYFRSAKLLYHLFMGRQED